MNLYLVPNDPLKTVLFSADGATRYRITTRRKYIFGPPLSRIYRPVGTSSVPSKDDKLVAEIEWKRWSHPVVRSDAFDGTMHEIELREFLYKLGKKFSTTRYFLGSDDKEYCWKDTKGTGHILSSRVAKREVARFNYDVALDGTLAGQKKWFIQVQPSELSLDMIILTFVIMEKRRREREAHPERRGFGDENPFESGFDGGVGA
ncbi:hypothetical protein EUX98_g9239 [Antrodiella citrinella]|uniref:DUF6593 domain-containing protein n=1 Tax=Antrodiella citrinella TaxID=2447956 RepID=A0A4V3XFA8_9APHY|nr:hypothetical protein EUX98_g9239 [Antrodiella citrinella]